MTAELEETRRARESAADRAERTAQRLQSLLATLPAGVVVVDGEGRIQETNRAAEVILGENLEGKSWAAAMRAARSAHPLQAAAIG